MIARASTLLAALLTLSSCGAATTSTSAAPRTHAHAQLGTDPVEAETPGRPPTRDEEEAIRPLLRAAERIRGLRFAREVPVRVQTSEQIVDFVQAQIDDEELEHARVFYVAIGLLPEGLDVRALLLRVMGEQIVGFYDPERGTMVMREDVARDLRALRSAGRSIEGSESAMVLVHEYVHALQDQDLALGDHYDDERSIDAENAFASLVEGDATLSMIGWLALAQGGHLSSLTGDLATLRTMVQGGDVGGGNGAEMAAAPPIVRAPLLSRYLDGMLFCATLHGHGSFAAVDDAHRTLPVSTEQILHPDRYFAHEGPEAITLPELPAMAAEGYAPHDEDTLGELELSVWMAIGSSGDRDRVAAAGWGGDRLRVYRGPGTTTAAVWWTTWDDEAEAIEAERAVTIVGSHVFAVRGHRVGRALSILIDVPDAAAASIESTFDTWAGGLP
jgi:hypothetical protein